MRSPSKSTQIKKSALGFSSIQRPGRGRESCRKTQELVCAGMDGKGGEPSKRDGGSAVLNYGMPTGFGHVSVISGLSKHTVSGDKRTVSRQMKQRQDGHILWFECMNRCHFQGMRTL